MTLILLPKSSILPPIGYVFNSGDTAWMLCATALVLLMTMPGLAIYYSGMVREKNVLACTMQGRHTSPIHSSIHICIIFSSIYFYVFMLHVLCTESSL